MTRLILRTITLGLAFAFVMPHIPGFKFHGQFLPDALIYALLFSVTALVVNTIAYIAVAVLGIVTLGLALVVIWPVRLLGWWILAAYQLMLLAKFFPQHLAVSGWQTALLAGLVVMVVNVLTNKFASDANRYS